jgi:predicted O-methyltransferase YrrM
MSLAARRLVPELLDHIAPGDPAAIASRRDLRRINRLTAQPRLAARLLRRASPRPPRRILELGAGDGVTSLALARRLARHWPGVTMVLVDRHDLAAPRTRAGFDALGWRVETAASDVFDWLDAHAGERFDVVLANLFLHHLDADLPRLLDAAARLAPVFLATEPRRTRMALAGARALALIGVGAVTRHDAPASVRAGFAGDELTRLWPREGWSCEERAAGPFTHVFLASRTGDA